MEARLFVENYENTCWTHASRNVHYIYYMDGGDLSVVFNKIFPYFVILIFYMHFFQEFIFPEGVALPAGGPTNQPLILLEVHYDNPNRRSGTQV